MIDLLFWLLHPVIPANATAAPMTVGVTGSVPIGFIVLAVIVSPVIVLTIAAMFGSPRTFRVPGLFLGSVILLISAIIASFAASSVLLKFIVPQ